MACALSASAQSTSDAINFSENNYYGTARSMALGNAMTAVGGDLGSIGLNPAGAAVVNYSQITLTNNISIASTNASYDAQAGQDAGPFARTGHTRFTIPNIGVVANFETGAKYGWKNFTMGFLYNGTNHYIGKINVGGLNSYSSLTGALATQATDWSSNTLNSATAFTDSDAPWNALLAYKSGMIQELDGNTSVYKGAAEIATKDGSNYNISMPAGGELKQTYMRKDYGSKGDMILNFAANYSDVFYVGVNLGMPVGNYSFREQVLEEAVDPSMFPTVFASGTAHYTDSRYTYAYQSDFTGVYAKVGMIWRPFGGLRLAAAIQTPTAALIEERYSASAACNYDKTSGKSESPEGNYSYNLTTAYNASLGVAYTLGSVLLLSADYEMTDFSHMKYSDIQTYDDFISTDYFAEQNYVNSLFAGVQHAGRFGVEFRPTSTLSIRAGYGFKTQPEKYYINESGEFIDAFAYKSDMASYSNGTHKLVEEHKYGGMTKSISAGFGISSPDGFYVDFAVRATDYPQAQYSLYSDYTYYAGTTKVCPSPGSTAYRRVIDAVVTLGMKF